MKFGFCGPHYTSESPIADNQQTINLYPEFVESGVGRNNIVLYPTPGLLQFSTSTPTGPTRGVIAVNGRLFVVIRSTLYEVSSAGVLTDRGTITGVSGTVSMAASDTRILIIASSTTGYVFNLSANTLTTITSAGFPANPIVAGYSDGYFIVLSTDNYFYISTIDNPLTWSATERETVQTPSNIAVGMLIFNRQIWYFGERLTQPFWNSGNPDFPFEANLSATINQGLASRFGATVIPDLNTVAWLGKSEAGDGVIYMADGYSPVRISDHSVEAAIQGYTAIDDVIAYSFQMKGHPTVSFTFPTPRVTWRYDCSTKMWHQALYRNTGTGAFEAHRGLYHAHIFDRHIVTDRANGKIYTMDLPSVTAGVGSFTTDDGDIIRRIRRCPHIHNENKTIFYGSLTLILEAGLGLATGQGSDPTVTMRMSNDGGKTFPPGLVRQKSAGAIGEWKRRVKFDYLGSARDRVFEVEVTDPVPFRFIDAELQAEVGVS